MKFTAKGLYYHALSVFSRGKLTLARDARIKPSARINFRRGRVSIGRSVTLQSGSLVDAQRGYVTLGSDVSINHYSIVLGLGGVEIGNYVRIAAHCMIVSFDHNFAARDVPITKQGVTKKPVVIEDDVWIGAGAKILGGTVISRGCVIGANAVVKGKTEPYGVYVGNPARLLKYRDGRGEPTMLKHGSDVSGEGNA